VKRCPVCTILLMLMLSCWAVFSPAKAQAKGHSFTVLVLNSYHIGYSWGESVLNGIRRELAESGLSLKVHYEFMDTKFYSPQAVEQPLVQLYKSKYATTHFDAIIASDNNALNFLIAHRDTLFPKTPVTFCGVTRFRPEMLQGRNGFTGVAEDVDVAGTISLILRLFPKTRHIGLVSGGVTTSSKNNLEHALEEVRDFAGRLDAINLSGLNPQELKKRLETLPQDTALLYLSYYRTPDGTVLDVDESTGLVAEWSGVPVFSPWLYTMGNGVMGGRVVSGAEQGRKAAQLAVQILRGTAVEALPVIQSQESKTVLDYRQLKRFSLSKHLLPAGSEVLFEPETLFYKYRTSLIIVLACFLWLTLTVFVLLWLLREKTRAAQELQRREERLQSLVALNDLAETPYEQLIQFGLDRLQHLLQAKKALALTFDSRGTLKRYCLCTASELGWHDGPGLQYEQLFSPFWLEVLHKKTVQRIRAGAESDAHSWPCETGRFAQSIALPVWEGERVHGLILLGRDSGDFSRADEQHLMLLMQGIMDIILKRRARERQEQLESELRHSQKMEAIGTVAGGIAHDFNNIISAISSCCELALEDIPPGNPAREDMKQSLKAASRGKQVISRIRTFCSRSEAPAESVYFPALVEECLELLTSLLPSTVELRVEQEISGSGTVVADPGDLHQILMNLCLNADHAMLGQQGTLRVLVREVCVSSSLAAAPPELSEGEYICLTVEDTGKGISSEVLPRIFDPFFTTRKEHGGTGLGLSTVQEICRKYKGLVTVESEEGKGSAFHVFLPEEEHPAADVDTHAKEHVSVRGTERLLVVDDDPELLYSVAKYLSRQGYQVRSCSRSMEALELVRNDPDQFDLLLADQIMPELTGSGLAWELLDCAPDMPVILYSGYSGENADDFVQELEALGVAAFIAKPFENHELGMQVRRVLTAKKERDDGASSHN